MLIDILNSLINHGNSIDVCDSQWRNGRREFVCVAKFRFSVLWEFVRFIVQTSKWCDNFKLTQRVIHIKVLVHLSHKIEDSHFPIPKVRSIYIKPFDRNMSINFISYSSDQNKEKMYTRVTSELRDCIISCWRRRKKTK